jgi:hypothetical protein
MRLASDRLPLWFRLVVLALASTTIAATPLPVSAHGAAAPLAAEPRLRPLERVEQVSVLVDDMTPDAETLSLTRALIQADAEAQLRSNGLRVRAEGAMPALYFQISVLCDDVDPCAVDVSSAAVQDVYLDAMATASIRAKTWYTGQIILAPRAEVNETVRNAVRGQADEFAADVQEARRQVLGAAPSSRAPAPAETRPDYGPRRGN